MIGRGPDESVGMRASFVLGTVLLSLAIGVCLLLGTLGWFAIGFGMMTDCTNNYSCTETGCPPCATTERWINAGGITQWILAGAGLGLAIWGIVRTKDGSRLAVGALVLLVASTATVVGTTWRASESYCQPGTPGYAASYCSVSA